MKNFTILILILLIAGCAGTNIISKESRSETIVHYNQPEKAYWWAWCMGLFDAIALVRSGDEVDFGDAMASGGGKIEWEETFEVRDDMPYGKAWLPVRAAAIRGLDTLAGPDHAAHLALIQLAEFARVFYMMDEIRASDGPESIGQLTERAPWCFDIYDELVAQGVIER